MDLLPIENPILEIVAMGNDIDLSTNSAIMLISIRRWQDIRDYYSLKYLSYELIFKEVIA